MQGGPTTSPVLMLNCPLWKLHSTTSPSTKPSESRPGPWVQWSSVTKNSPSRLNTASTRSPASTRMAVPGATSAVPHKSMRVGAAMALLVDAGRRKMPLLFPESKRMQRMDSESARMSSAAEARFRIDYPNSQPRVIKVVALDEMSERVVKRVAQQFWQRANFFTSLKFEGAARGEGWSMKAWLSDLAGRTKALVEEVACADLVVMVSSAGTSAEAASVLGDACAARK